jgi:hypothetical protein
MNIITGESKIADSNIYSHYTKLAKAIGETSHLNTKIKI